MIIRALRTFAFTSGSSSSAITIKSDCIQPSDICRQQNSSGRPCRLMRQALQIWLNSKSESQARSYLTNQNSILSHKCHEKNCLKMGFTGPVLGMVLQPEIECHKCGGGFRFGAEWQADIISSKVSSGTAFPSSGSSSAIGYNGLGNR
jgi:hypothetical protein